jgi:hypothetical protein
LFQYSFHIFYLLKDKNEKKKEENLYICLQENNFKSFQMLNRIKKKYTNLLFLIIFFNRKIIKYIYICMYVQYVIYILCTCHVHANTRIRMWTLSKSEKNIFLYFLINIK